MSDSIVISLIQDSFLVGDIQGNKEKILRLAAQAREAGADLAVFPELALCGYPPEDLLLRPEFIQQIEAAVQDICQQSTGIHLLFGAPNHQDGHLYNAAFWCHDGKVLGRYNKYILPNYAVFDEKRYFTEGDQPLVLTINNVSLGVSVCEDVWYAEPVAAARQAGAVSLVTLNASPFHLGKYTQRLEVLRSRQQETGLSQLYVNLVGGQDELVFDGESLVLDPQGELAGRAPAFEAAQILCRLYRDGSVEVQTPMADRFASEDGELYRALVTGVRDYVTNNGFDGVVLGLSGGIDSALTLAIAVDALGKDQVHAVMMPSRYTADISQTDAGEEAENLGVDYQVIPIEPCFHAFLDVLEPVLRGKEPDTTEENLQARCRGVILMAMSNKLRRMLLTTGNKSEMAVGYSTLYGDMAGGFAPLKDVTKTWVYRLSRYRNTISPVIPERVIERAPSAELRPDQTDQDSLPPYDILDPILEMTVEQDCSREDIMAKGFDAATVDRVVRMVQFNEYKRRQAPPGVRVTRRAFGRDRRYPITSGYRPA